MPEIMTDPSAENRNDEAETYPAAPTAPPRIRAGIVNRVHEALQSTLDMAELSRIIAAMLVSRSTMGFSRAALMHWDGERFEVFSALGADDRAAHERIQREIEDESVKFGMAPPAPDPGSAESTGRRDPALLEQFENFDHRGYWLWVYEKFQKDNALKQKLDGCRIPFGGIPAQTITEDADFIGYLFQQRNSLPVTARRLAAAGLPEACRTVFAGDSLWAGIRAKDDSPRLILIVDKMHEKEPIHELDRLHLNWFCAQAALAMENAELFADLQEKNRNLRELDTLKSNFLSTISHELRSPLTSIFGFTRLLLENKAGMINPGQKQILERVMSQADKLGSVLNDLIEIAEIDAGSTVNVDVVAVDPLDVLMDTLPKLESRRAGKSVLIEPVTHGPVPKILSDAKALGRIFYHLIDNAIKFSRDNGKVLVEFAPEDGEMAIHIKDMGIGIAPEQQQRIFEAFYQVDSHLSRVYEGMGIGLTLTTKLVARTGGRLLLQSSLNQGSTFTVIYPLADSA